MKIKDTMINGKLKQSLKLLINKFHENMWSRRFERVSKSEKLIDMYCNLFENFKGLNVLDIGCFSGFFSFLISDVANNTIGIDKRKNPIRFANELKDILNIQNAYFINKYIRNFIQDGDHLSLNINSLFIHKAMDQMTEKDINSIRSIASRMKIIITAGKQLNDIDCFKKIKSKSGLYILKNKLGS